MNIIENFNKAFKNTMSGELVHIITFSELEHISKLEDDEQRPPGHVTQSARGCGDQDSLCSEVGEVGNRTKT